MGIWEQGFGLLSKRCTLTVIQGEMSKERFEPKARIWGLYCIADILRCEDGQDHLGKGNTEGKRS